MTRVNVGIFPEELSNQLLIAELREIKRIPNLIKSGKFNLNKIPDRFTLGTGHVAFFYNKLGYLKKRYQKLYQEARKDVVERRLNVQDFSDSFENIDPYFMNDYEETERDRNILLERFREKGHKLGDFNGCTKV